MFKSVAKFRHTINEKWSALIHDKGFVFALILGAFIFIFGQYILISASRYNDEMFQVVSVGDFFLDLLPTVNLSFLFTWGMWIIMIPVAFYAILVRPELAPWALKTYGLFAIVRAGFILLTHLGPPEGLLYLQDPVLYEQNPIFERFFFMNDLFFSGHVGNAYLGALIFRDYKFKWFCLVGSVVMGVTVLLMHVHYSIDVFGAYFITYGIYALSNRVFHKWNGRFKGIVEKHANGQEGVLLK